jgi:hypothetical protein
MTFDIHERERARSRRSRACRAVTILSAVFAALGAGCTEAARTTARPSVESTSQHAPPTASPSPGTSLTVATARPSHAETEIGPTRLLSLGRGVAALYRCTGGRCTDRLLLTRNGGRSWSEVTPALPTGSFGFNDIAAFRNAFGRPRRTTTAGELGCYGLMPAGTRGDGLLFAPLHPMPEAPSS